MREEQIKDLQLSRIRIVNDLASATHPNHRKSLEAALAHLDKKIADLTCLAEEFPDHYQTAGGSGESHSSQRAGWIGTRGAPSGQKTRCQRGNRHHTNADPNASGFVWAHLV